MNFVTHNQAEIRIDGTHLQGVVDISYGMLTELLGPPAEGDGYKTDAEWIVQFEDGVVITIYNYKNGPSYMGKHGTPPHLNVDWHIGGFEKSALDYFNQYIVGINDYAVAY
jgi:hypothetical protein